MSKTLSVKPILCAGVSLLSPVIKEKHERSQAFYPIFTRVREQFYFVDKLLYDTKLFYIVI
jgi:hypothetical protein